MISIDPASRVKLYALAMRSESDELVVGRVDTGLFVAMPPVAAEVIRLLERGASPLQVESELAQSGQHIDVTGFVGDLVELGFVSSINDLPMEGTRASAERALPWVTPAVARALFNRTTFCAYMIVVLIAITRAIRVGELPTYRMFFWTASPTLLIVVPTLVFLASAFVHEVAHIAAARAVGADGRWGGIGSRRHHVVFQTDLSALWSVPPERRIVAYLAGAVWDTLFISMAFMAISFQVIDGPVASALAAGCLLVGMSTASQFYFHTRSDLYFVLRDKLGADDLLPRTEQHLRTLIERLLRNRPQALPGIVQTVIPHDVQIYRCFFILGIVAWISSLALFGLPILFVFVVRAVRTFWEGTTHTHVLRALDGFVALSIQATASGFPLVTALRRRRASGSRAA